MWPFGKAVSKDRLQQHKRVKVNGWRITIRKLNPLLDFPGDRMPQVFSSYMTRRPAPEAAPAMTDQQQKRVEDDMKMIVQAGVVAPRLVPVGKGEAKGQEDGITVDDLFREPDTGLKLYVEIMVHSMNAFHGLKGVFFSIKTKLLLSMRLRKTMAAPLPRSSSPTAVAP